MIKVIPIRKKPIHIIITYFDKIQYQYWLNDLNTKNKNCDIGCWNVKYKNKLGL